MVQSRPKRSVDHPRDDFSYIYERSKIPTHNKKKINLRIDKSNEALKFLIRMTKKNELSFAK